MRVARVLVHTTMRISTVRSYQLVLLLAAVLAVVAFYYFGSDRHNFSSTTKRIKQSQASYNANKNDADLSLDTTQLQHDEWEVKRREEKVAAEEGRYGREERGAVTVQHYHVLMMFTKVDKRRSLQEKFKVVMLSILKHGSLLEGEVLVLHFVSDEASKLLGEVMLSELLLSAPFQYEVVFHDVELLTQKLHPIVEAMQKLFSSGTGAYYSDAIFFLSVAMHRIMPKNMSRILLLDLDLKFRTNIRDLFQEFDRFPPEAVIGIAREMQPVYRHTFWQYRKANPKSKVGEPPPDGRPGFNSGVTLLNLERMRDSALYNQLLEPGDVAKLANHYHFKGHLGDQDFFSMIGMEHPELFYPLACGWNRQLCTWWREHGYRDVFQLYHRCDGPVHIYHGNCNSPIPDD